jgi:hypothetical protein
MLVRTIKLLMSCTIVVALNWPMLAAGLQSTPSSPDLSTLSLEDLIRSLHLQTSYTWINAQWLRRTVHCQPLAIHGPPPPTRSICARHGCSRRWTLNSSIYSVSRLERTSPSDLPPTKQFVRLDTHLSFNVFESIKLTAGVDNLSQKKHPEFDPQDGYSVRSQVPRSAFVKAIWSF